MFNNNPRILIIEESPENLEHVSTILTKCGYLIDIVINGLYASAKLITTEYDLVILDLTQPDINGGDFISMIRNSPQNENMPIIFILPVAAKGVFGKEMKIGNYDFVNIPIDEKELLTRINYQIELKRSRLRLEKSEAFKSSLNYAVQLQSCLLPPSQLFDELFSNHFLLNLPLDIVGGDFYWVKRIENFIVVGLADATGHGVPGAFLSVLGISLLNEISGGFKYEKPSQILNALREKIKSSLRNSHNQSMQSNGLDMAICVIDTTSNEMCFSGANQSVLILRGTTIIELKGDRQPIGSFINERPFRERCISILNGDRIYFSSDGYADQIGGDRKKKFQKSNFIKLLGNMVHEPLVRQKEILLENHLDWKGDNEQVDDILVLGLELPVLQAI